MHLQHRSGHAGCDRPTQSLTDDLGFDGPFAARNDLLDGTIERMPSVKPPMRRLSGASSCLRL